MRALRWRIFWLLAGIAGTLLGLYLALRPPGGGPSFFPLDDKIQHALSYVAMGLWFGALYELRHQWRVALSLFLFGVLVECLQWAMALGRSADVADLGANTLGIAVAAAGTRWLGSSWMARVERLFGVG